MVQTKEACLSRPALAGVAVGPAVIVRLQYLLPVSKLKVKVAIVEKSIYLVHEEMETGRSGRGGGGKAGKLLRA